jgi:Zn-dependent M28 family amino/carboxypeptidase
VVFVGYGIKAPEEDWDDYKGADLQGKVLLMLNDDPHWDPDLFAGERKLYYGRWWYKYEIAAKVGAAAAIIIHTAPSAGYPWTVVETSWSGEQFRLTEDKAPKVILEAWLTEDASRRLVAMAGLDLDNLLEEARSRDFAPIPMGITTGLTFRNDIRATQSGNVAGFIPGSDPALAQEVVIFSAHHDHLGIGEPDDTGDTIYNGALDNGIAMAQALEVAEAMASLDPRPRRSLMFLFVAAEEQGLLGSRHFAQSGRFHPGRIAANINFELGNVWGPTRDIIIYGKGKSTLEDRLEALATAQGRTVRAENDLRAGWYYRSDQFSFARIGVPSIWFKSGVDFVGKPDGWGEETYAAWIRDHYHRPSDEVTPDWNLEGLMEDARLALSLGLDVANRQELPAWYPGDEFEDERQEALKACSDL